MASTGSRHARSTQQIPPLRRRGGRPVCRADADGRGGRSSRRAGSHHAHGAVAGSVLYLYGIDPAGADHAGHGPEGAQGQPLDRGSDGPGLNRAGPLPHHGRAGPADGHGDDDHQAADLFHRHKDRRLPDRLRRAGIRMRSVVHAAGRQSERLHRTGGRARHGAYLLAGFIVTVPDYEGTNLDWGAGQESGYGTLDAIRATESYLGASSSTKIGMVGYSGGAIATEWAAELAPSYAPALHIIGAAAGGVPVDFAHNLTYINGDDDWYGVIPAVLVSLGRAFGVNITQYLSSYGEELTSQVSSECIATFASAYPGLTIQQLLPQYSNPFDVP